MLAEVPYVGAWLQEYLQKHFPGIRIHAYDTEYEFIEYWQCREGRFPRIVILGMKVRWTRPSPNPPEPPETWYVDEHWRAGLRCYDMIRKTPGADQLPIIFSSVVERSAMKAEELARLTNFTWIEQCDDDGRIVKVIRQLSRWR